MGQLSFFLSFCIFIYLFFLFILQALHIKVVVLIVVFIVLHLVCKTEIEICTLANVNRTA